MKKWFRTTLVMMFCLMHSNHGIRAAEFDKKTSLSGTAAIRVDAGKINNILTHTHRSTGKVEIGAIENARINNTNIRVEADNIDNTINGGENNKALVRMGKIENSVVRGRATIDVHANSVANAVNGGSGNHAEISVGVITGNDEEPASSGYGGLRHQGEEVQASIMNVNARNSASTVQYPQLVAKNTKLDTSGVTFPEPEKEKYMAWLRLLVEERTDVQKLLSKNSKWNETVAHPFEGAGPLYFDVRKMHINALEKESVQDFIKLAEKMATHGPNNALGLPGYSKWSKFVKRICGDLACFHVDIWGPDNGVIIPSIGVNTETKMPMFALLVVNTKDNTHPVTGLQYFTLERVDPKDDSKGMYLVNVDLSRNVDRMHYRGARVLAGADRIKGDNGGVRGGQIANWEAFFVDTAKLLNLQGTTTGRVDSVRYACAKNDKGVFSNCGKTYFREFKPLIDDIDDNPKKMELSQINLGKLFDTISSNASKYELNQVLRFEYDPKKGARYYKK